MKKWLLVLTVALSVHVAFGQRVKAKWGATTSISRKSHFKKIVGVSNGYLYALRSESTGFLGPYILFLEKYSLDGLRLKSSTPLAMPKENGKETEFKKLLATKDHLYLFTTGFHKDKKEKAAYAYLINDSNKPSNGKVVDKVENALSYKDGSFDFVITEDSSHVLVYHNKPFAKKNNEKFSYKLYDLSLNEKWQRSIEIPYPDKEVTIKKYFGDKQENIYMLAKVEEPAAKNEANYKYLVLAYYAATNELKEFEVSLPKKAITQIQLALLEDGSLVAAGFYSEKTRAEDRMGGTFFLKINNTDKNISASGFEDFQPAFLKQFLTDKQAEKGRELESLKVNYLEPTSDSSYLLVAEQYYEKQICLTDPRTGMLECTDHYYYNDLVALKISENGKVTWGKRIPKRQYSTNQQNPHFSYLFGVGTETMHFVFLDNPKNLDIENDGYAKHTTNPNRAALVNVTLRLDGTISKDVLYEVRDKQTVMMPDKAYQINKGHFFVYGEGRKVSKIGELIFE